MYASAVGKYKRVRKSDVRAEIIRRCEADECQHVNK